MVSGGDRGQLMFPPLVRASDPTTSHAAAASVDLKAGQARVHAALVRIGFGTDRQIAMAAGMELASAVKRRGELVARGLVVDTGMTGVTPTGRKAIVWELA